MVKLTELKPPLSTQDKWQPQVLWELLPEDFILPDDPVESILQPLLAAALTEALDLAGLITTTMLIATNMAITTKINGETVVKAPDWFLVSHANPVEKGIIRRSYTPHREGEIPAVVMEFLSETDGGEYSLRPEPPYGKMWFYEQIIKAPLYIIFAPYSGKLEVRQLNVEGKYELQSLDENQRFWLESLNLYLGVWYGTRLGETAYWLRWWDKDGNLLLWGSELIQREKKRADEAELEIARLKQLLKQSGLDN